MTNTITLPALGSKVKALFIPGITNVDGDDRYTGTTVIVTDTNIELPHTRRDGEHVRGPVCYADFPDPNGTLSNRRFYFSEWEVVEEAKPRPQMPALWSFIEITEISTNDATLRTSLMGTIAVVVGTNEENYAYRKQEDGEYRWSPGPTVFVRTVGTPHAKMAVVDWRETTDPIVNDPQYTLLAKYAQAEDRLNESVSKHERSLNIISKALISAADNRGWCSEYDDFVQDVNGDLPGPFYLDERERDYEVTLRRVRVVYESVTVTVTATGDPDSDDLYDLAVDAAQYENWDEDDDEIREIEVTDYTVA